MKFNWERAKKQTESDYKIFILSFFESQHNIPKTKSLKRNSESDCEIGWEDKKQTESDYGVNPSSSGTKPSISMSPETDCIVSSMTNQSSDTCFLLIINKECLHYCFGTTTVRWRGQ